MRALIYLPFVCTEVFKVLLSDWILWFTAAAKLSGRFSKDKVLNGIRLIGIIGLMSWH